LLISDGGEPSGTQKNRRGIRKKNIANDVLFVGQEEEAGWARWMEGQANRKREIVERPGEKQNYISRENCERGGPKRRRVNLCLVYFQGDEKGDK